MIHPELSILVGFPPFEGSLLRDPLGAIKRRRPVPFCVTVFSIGPYCISSQTTTGVCIDFDEIAVLGPHLHVVSALRPAAAGEIWVIRFARVFDVLIDGSCVASLSWLTHLRI